MKRVLHTGCGAERLLGAHGFSADEWEELRLDIEPGAKPDIVASMTNMAGVPDGSVDAIYSSHNLEHLAPHELPLALAEFLRVLAADGYLLATCPDLQSVCELVARDRLDETIYISKAGPIAPMDILYGHRPSLANGQIHMAHRMGFTEKVLRNYLLSAGFASAASMRDTKELAIYAVATRKQATPGEIRQLFTRHWLCDK